MNDRSIMSIPHFADYIKRMADLESKKGHDYASVEDPFKNFLECENLQICSAEKGILVRMADKITRVSNLIEKNEEAQVADEKLDDTLIDLANYAIILACYLKSKKNKESNKTPTEDS